MNLSKELKKKRDAESRQKQGSPQTIYIEGTGYIDFSKLATKVELTEGLAEKSDKDHSHAFLDLDDTPLSYIANKVLLVNSTGDAIILGDGPPAANGLPVGGTAGQIPVKNSNNDYDVIWGNAPSGGNIYENAVDEPPATPSQWDDEFDGISLNVKWGWINQKGCAATVDGKLHLSGLNSSGICGLVETAPTDNYIVTIKHKLFGGFVNYLGGGLFLYNSNLDKCVEFINQLRDTAYGQHISAYRYSDVLNTQTSVTIGYSKYPNADYLRARIESGTIYFEASADGVNWITIFTELISTHLGEITHIGLAIYQINSSNKISNTFDWFRVTQL